MEAASCGIGFGMEDNRFYEGWKNKSKFLSAITQLKKSLLSIKDRWCLENTQDNANNRW